jgi:hypothetical protein
MAYAFNKVDDYFRRNKTGNQGSLEKGNMGAPAPTAAAENLAKTAETSGQQGNSETGQFRAAKSANTSAIQGSLTQPATQQVQNWTTSETARAGDVTKAGEESIAKTYTPFSAGDVAKAEKGEANPLTQQINYSGKELTFNPYQVQMPAIETQQQLSGGIGGIQAALQKQRGGRYTAGMGALDASVLASSNQGMQGVRSALGGLRETARGTQQGLEQTDENLAAKAGTTASGISQAARAAVTSRSGALRAALEAKAAEEQAGKMRGVYQYQGEASNAVNADFSRGRSTGLSNYGSITADMIPGLMTRAQPKGGNVEVDYNEAAPVVPIMQKTINTTGDFSPEYINLMTTLGVTPEKMTTLTGSGYGYDSQGAVDAGQRSGENLNTQFSNLLKGGEKTRANKKKMDEINKIQKQIEDEKGILSVMEKTAKESGTLKEKAKAREKRLNDLENKILGLSKYTNKKYDLGKLRSMPGLLDSIGKDVESYQEPDSTEQIENPGEIKKPEVALGAKDQGAVDYINKNLNADPKSREYMGVQNIISTWKKTATPELLAHFQSLFPNLF